VGPETQVGGLIASRLAGRGRSVGLILFSNLFDEFRVLLKLVRSQDGFDGFLIGFSNRKRLCLGICFAHLTSFDLGSKIPNGLYTFGDRVFCFDLLYVRQIEFGKDIKHVLTTLRFGDHRLCGAACRSGALGIRGSGARKGGDGEDGGKEIFHSGGVR